MKNILIALAILAILAPFSFAQWQHNSQQLRTEIEINSYADIKLLSPNGYAESATVALTFFPKQAEMQDLLKLDTDPEAEVSEQTMKFTWRRPEKRIDFGMKAEVKTTNSFIEVRDKIDFPIEELPEDVLIYTKPTITIDSDQESIIKLASELVKGEDDLYSAVFALAEWTKNNIDYDLSTLTAEVSQKASWVLENKQGVCDELTSLFIALNRAVGIPAKFVSGIAYTESDLFPDKWGPHGWAEVYFPNYGWIPFDVTYGQFGWVDPTHIKFKESYDPDEPTAHYQLLAKNADLISHDLDIKAKVVEKIGDYKIPLKIEASALKKTVSFGSYNLIEAIVENPNGFYYSNEIYLNNPSEVQVIGRELKSILLMPKEKKKLYWIVKIDSGLDSRYSYTFPIVVRTINNISSQTEFESNVRNRYASLDEVSDAAKLLEEEKEKKYSGNVLFACNTSKDTFFTYEDVKLNCILKNTGNIFLEDVEVCFEGKCSNADFGISQSKELEFEINKSSIGQIQEIVTLRNALVSKSSYVRFEIKDKPRIEIENLQYPENASFGRNFTISFAIAKKSITNPNNVEVVLLQNGVEEKWAVGELSEDKKFVVNLAGSELRYGKNEYKLNVYYTDELNSRQVASQEFKVMLTDASPFQRLVLTIAFLAVVLVLFRKKTG
ncbi:transglutaminase domain-containing protein [Candidatus Woesearchaeota archaeon]|nr:transglutaminase domain-containing protein [Candidatus Woesearchaeota archaeon]